MTIKDVARAAGVSTQTVSRVLNSRPDVAPQTLERVRRVIAELGYSPNALARSLIQGRTRTLGVVAYGLEYFGPSRVLTGIEQQAIELGYSIFLNLLHRPETADVGHLLNRMVGRQVEGVIWAIPSIGANRAWARAGTPEMPVPVTFVGGMAGPSQLPAVGVDNWAIGALAIAHLLAGAARRIGVITGPLAWWEAAERLRGWRETLAQHGREVEETLIVEGDWNAESGARGLHELLRRCPNLDAIFVSNDQMALGALYAAHRLGRQVPEDLSIVGVDCIPESAHFWPPLTTVRQRLREAGAQAVEQLHRMIQAEPPTPGLTLLQPELIVRESSRPVAGHESPTA
jgi:LacI family transcriptional regulator